MLNMCPAASFHYDQSLTRHSPKQPRENDVCQISNDVTGQRSSSLSVPKPYGTEMRTSSGVIDRTFRSPEVLTDEQVADQVAGALVVDFGQFKSTHKVIAQAAGSSVKTAENWTSGATAPSLANFLRLLPHSPALQSMVKRVMGLEAELHPNFQRELVALMQRYAR